jgi:hypothetical protein
MAFERPEWQHIEIWKHSNLGTQPGGSYEYSTTIGRTMSQRLEFAPVALQEKPFGMRLYVGPNRRSTHPIDQLARRLDAVCRTAVDAWQIAAVLESDGINDSIAREEYGMNDVFELAEELFRRVPLRLGPVQTQTTGRILVKTLRELSHGPLLAWPLLSIPALLTVIGPSQLEWGALIGLIIGWAWALGSSRLAERLRSRDLTEVATTVLRSHVLLSGLVLVLAVALAWASGPRLLGATALAAGIIGLTVSSRALTNEKLELWWFLASLPGAGLGLAHMLWPAAVNPQIALIGAAGSVVLTGFAALLGALQFNPLSLTAWKHKIDGPRARLERLRFEDWLEFIGFTLLGAACGLLVAFGANAVQPEIPLHPLVLAVTLGPLLVGAGALGWPRRRFLERARQHLKRSYNLEKFYSRVRRSFLAALVRCWVALGLLSWVAFAVAQWLGVNSQGVLELLIANAVLGGALLCTFLLASQGRVGLAVSSAVAAVALEAILVIAAPHDVVSFSLAHLMACIVLLVTTVPACLRSVARLSNYR